MGGPPPATSFSSGPVSLRTVSRCRTSLRVLESFTGGPPLIVCSNSSRARYRSPLLGGTSREMVPAFSRGSCVQTSRATELPSTGVTRSEIGLLVIGLFSLHSLLISRSREGVGFPLHFILALPTRLMRSMQEATRVVLPLTCSAFNGRRARRPGRFGRASRLPEA